MLRVLQVSSLFVVARRRLVGPVFWRIPSFSIPFPCSDSQHMLYCSSWLQRDWVSSSSSHGLSQGLFTNLEGREFRRASSKFLQLSHCAPGCTMPRVMQVSFLFIAARRRLVRLVMMMNSVFFVRAIKNAIVVLLWYFLLVVNIRRIVGRARIFLARTSKRRWPYLYNQGEIAPGPDSAGKAMLSASRCCQDPGLSRPPT